MTLTVKISAKSARLPFNGCEPEYIKNVCHARCCESSTAPTGTMITIHPSEQAAIEAIGGKVIGGFLQPRPGERKCPFKTGDNLCGIHFTDAKPFGCIASPFTLNKNGTLIVRNRYRLLKCFNDGRRIPAYKAFRASLDLIFGTDEAARICAHLDAGGGDIQATIPDRSYKILMDNDAVKHDAGKAPKTQNGKGPARVFGQDLMRGEHVVGENRLTWVAGDRPRDELDETSRKILAAGRRKMGYPHGPTVTRGPDGTLPYIGASRQDWLEESDGNQSSGTSIFDPVLCELAYTWFTAPGGHVLDPFAGGSVRGIVATYLGRQYTGIDLRPEQVEANEHQAAAIVPDRLPRWIVGNSLWDIPAEDYDFIFTCPPYYDLEIYSDHPEDLSNKEDYAGFLADYRAIIRQSCDRLRPDRFACVVVGDIRDKKGLYRNFVADTIAAFLDCGLSLYNEAVLVTAVGSLSIRVGRQFVAGRKLGKTHQNVLVFVKGDPRKATDWCGPVDVAALEGADEVGT